MKSEKAVAVLFQDLIPGNIFIHHCPCLVISVVECENKHFVDVTLLEFIVESNQWCIHKYLSNDKLNKFNYDDEYSVSVKYLKD